MRSIDTSSKPMLWTGRVLSGLAVLFMLMDGVMKLVRPSFVVQASAQLGYPASTLFGIGLALVLSTVIYVIPRTSVLGAILLTGYLGGALASNVRTEAPLFNLVFPVVFACFIWSGLWLRDGRLRSLLPVDSTPLMAQRTNHSQLVQNTSH